MANHHEQEDIPLGQQSSSFSDSSFGSHSTIIASPLSPRLHKDDHGYDRVPSLLKEDDSHSIESALHSPKKPDHGLGITNLAVRKRGSTKTSPNTPGSAKAFLSPSSATLGDVDETPYHMGEEWSAYNSTNTDEYELYTASSDRERLHQDSSSGLGIDRNFACGTKQPIATGRVNRATLLILALSVYSTICSGLWLGIAIRQPNFDKVITSGNALKNLNVLFTALARSIELSFVTVFVAVTGQILSTRAVGVNKGVTLADMLMRSWASSPGSMFSHWEAVYYAARTWLGLIALLVALLSVFYTTASDALVAPHLTVMEQHGWMLHGRVATSFANASHVDAQCYTPISDSASTCIEIQHSGRSYHNYLQYLASWVDFNNYANDSADQLGRPSPVAILYDNTTVQGSWTNDQSMALLSKQYNGRIVNNITMAMPHAGVITAAGGYFPTVRQPQALNRFDDDLPMGLGEYFIRASVPSPAVNVLCAELTAQEMVPMIYNLWPSQYFNGTQPDTENWPHGFDLTTIPDPLRVTAVDDLFGFDDVNVHPIFPKWPPAYNTVFNYTGVYGRYIRGGTLQSICEEDDPLTYHNSNSGALDGIWIEDWPEVATDWGLALGLNDGIADCQSANARSLTQLIPTSDALDPSLPSISEALAVLAGNALLLSSIDTPFNYGSGNNYTGPRAPPKVRDQSFYSTLKVQNYNSGSTQPWQRILFVILYLVFLGNICCLIYLLLHGNHTTDFLEPQNLFCLAQLSPPSEVLGGACGGGPDRKHFKTRWNVKLNEEQGHLWIASDDKRSNRWSSSTLERPVSANAVATMYNKIREKRTSKL